MPHRRETNTLATQGKGDLSCRMDLDRYAKNFEGIHFPGRDGYRPGDPCPESGCPGILEFDDGDPGGYMDPGTDPALFCPNCGDALADDRIDWDFLNRGRS